MDESAVLSILRHASRGHSDLVKLEAMSLAGALAIAGKEDLSREITEIFNRRPDMPLGLYTLKPKKTLAQLQLTPEVEEAANDFLNEQRKRDRLMKAGLEPRHKLLFVGPPGQGKTVLAGALSIELGVPSYIVRYDDLISKDPGATSRNLNEIFSYARDLHGCLLFFDEFDALGRDREDAQENGEMKRVTSTLLVQLDDVPSDVICVAATNHGQMLDGAIWRRFNIRIELPRPRLDTMEGFLRDMLAGMGYHPIEGEDRPKEVDIGTVIHRMMPENFSDVELFARNVVRSFVLSDSDLSFEETIWSESNKWASGQKKNLG